MRARNQFLGAGFLFASSAIIVSCGGVSGKDSASSVIRSFETPELGMRIARGYDPDAKEPLRGDCIKSPDTFLHTAWKDAQGIKAELSETRITSHEELMREMNFSTSASVRYKFYKGNANFSKYDKFTSSQDTFTWLFSIKAVSGESTLNLDQISMENLTDAARKMIVDGDKEGFRKLCGTQFIRSVKYGGRITNVQEISAKSTEQIHKIHADISASGGAAVWKASASAAFDQAIQEAQARSMLKREYSQEGGGTIHYDISPANLQNTLNAFSTALTQNNSVVLEVETADWSTVVNFDSGSLTDIARQQALQRLYKMIWQNKEKLEKIDQYIYLYENNRVELTQADIEDLSAKAAEIGAQQDEILLRGQACYEDATKCQQAGVTSIAVNFPTMVFKPALTKQEKIGQWTFDVPADVVLMEPILKDTLMAKYSRNFMMLPGISGNPLPVKIEAMLMYSCKESVNELRKYSSDTLTTSRGEKIPYLEMDNKIPDGRFMPQIGFGFEGRDGQCLMLSFYSDYPIPELYSIKENSELARVVRAIAQSVRN